MLFLISREAQIIQQLVGSRFSSNNIGHFNTAVGAGTLFANTADANTATGAGALLNNTTGTNNTATGVFAPF